MMVVDQVKQSNDIYKGKFKKLQKVLCQVLCNIYAI